MPKRHLGTVAVLAGLLAAAAPAHAGTLVGNPGKESAAIAFSGDAYDNEMGILYDGHAGLGAIVRDGRASAPPAERP